LISRRHKIEEQRRIDEAIYADKANEIAEQQRQLNIVDAERSVKWSLIYWLSF
jgi:hypothetical protein